AEDARLTASGVLAGTPHFMAPEQIQGKPADARSDLFALGGTLYALASGQPPFPGEAPFEVIKRVCDQPPPPLRRPNPAAPDWLEAVVGRLLAKDPNDRYPSAAAVAELLGGCLAHLERPESVPLPAGLAAPRPRRRRWLVLGAAALALAFVCLIGSPLIFGL